MFMEILLRVAMGLLIIIPGALIVHLYPNGTLFMLLKVHLWLSAGSCTFSNPGNLYK